MLAGIVWYMYKFVSQTCLKTHQEICKNDFTRTGTLEKGGLVRQAGLSEHFNKYNKSIHRSSLYNIKIL